MYTDCKTASFYVNHGLNLQIKALILKLQQKKKSGARRRAKITSIVDVYTKRSIKEMNSGQEN